MGPPFVWWILQHDASDGAGVSSRPKGCLCLTWMDEGWMVYLLAALSFQPRWCLISSSSRVLHRQQVQGGPRGLNIRRSRNTSKASANGLDSECYVIDSTNANNKSRLFRSAWAEEIGQVLTSVSLSSSKWYTRCSTCLHLWYLKLKQVRVSMKNIDQSAPFREKHLQTRLFN